MLTKGIIKTIDLLNNRCIIRIPLFETAGTKDEFISGAGILVPPGIYNGFNIGDVVIVGFGPSGPGDPVVLGKLYLGVKSEKESTGGSIHCTDFIATNSATLPINTNITSDNTGINIVNSNTSSANSYKTIFDITTAISKNTQKINELTEINKYDHSTIEHQIGYWIDDQILYKCIYIGDNTKNIEIPATEYTRINLAWIDLSCSFISTTTTPTTVRAIPETCKIIVYENKTIINTSEILSSTEKAYIALCYTKVEI